MAASIGHNNPPDPLAVILDKYALYGMEAENWLDGQPVTNEMQMQSVDALRAMMREQRTALEAGQKSEAAPHYDAWKAALARWKAAIDDVRRIEDGLVVIGDAFKRRLAAEKQEAARRAREEAEAARVAAARAAQDAAAGNIEQMREAARLQEAAETAQIAAHKAGDDKVRGLRSVTRFQVTDHRLLLHWIAAHDRGAVTDFVDDWARRNHRTFPGADGLKVWKEKEAY